MSKYCVVCLDSGGLLRMGSNGCCCFGKIGVDRHGYVSISRYCSFGVVVIGVG